MTEDEFGHTELPLFYRLVMRFPKLSVENLHPTLQGFFWVIGLPVFLICYVYSNLMLFVYIVFPYNYGLVLAIGFFLFMFVSRIIVGRIISSTDAVLNDKQVWREVKEAVEDYLNTCRDFAKRRDEETEESRTVE